jgi:hypothetical protein
MFRSLHSFAGDFEKYFSHIGFHVSYAVIDFIKKEIMEYN